MKDKPAFPNPINPQDYGKGMTLREYAAIRLKVPDSGNPELDKMIRESLRNDLAAKVMQGAIDVVGGEALTKYAYKVADAMLAESGK